MKRLCCLLAAVGFALAAEAHTPLVASVPADKGSVAAPVDAIVLEFGADVRLTSLALETAAGESEPLGELPTAVAAKFTVPVRAALAPGDYVATWRAVGADTHVISGRIAFSVTAAHSH